MKEKQHAFNERFDVNSMKNSQQAHVEVLHSKLAVQYDVLTDQLFLNYVFFIDRDIVLFIYLFLKMKFWRAWPTR